MQTSLLEKQRLKKLSLKSIQSGAENHGSVGESTCCTHTHEGLSLDPEHPREKPGEAVLAYDPSTETGQRQEDFWGFLASSLAGKKCLGSSQ